MTRARAWQYMIRIGPETDACQAGQISARVEPELSNGAMQVQELRDVGDPPTLLWR